MHKGEEGSIHVTMTPNDLVANGDSLVAKPDSRIFVLTSRGKYTAVSPTPDELRLFHPDVYPRCLAQTDFWKSKFKPVVDPEAIVREERLAVKATEETKAEAIKSLGIHWEGVSLRMPSGVIYIARFYRYPNGTSYLLNVFFSASRELHVVPSLADVQRDPAAFYIEEEYLNGEIPLRFSFNGQWMEKGKIFILQEDNTFKALELTPEESRQCTIDSFRNPKNLQATNLYRQKIAPALGVPVEAE